MTSDKEYFLLTPVYSCEYDGQKYKTYYRDYNNLVGKLFALEDAQQIKPNLYFSAYKLVYPDGKEPYSCSEAYYKKVKVSYKKFLEITNNSLARSLAEVEKNIGIRNKELEEERRTRYRAQEQANMIEHFYRCILSSRLTIPEEEKRIALLKDFDLQYPNLSPERESSEERIEYGWVSPF